MKNIIKYLIESFLVIFLVPYVAISTATSVTGLGIAILLLMAILPIYFVISPLRFSSKIIWLIPIYNSLLFLLTTRIIFNNSAEEYLIIYIPISYIAISLKLIFKHYKNKTCIKKIKK